ncbi:MAG: amidohydrolase [Proteobacteria bacterium]|nr:amidohydrolase [Pseudomonadota bacterium]
MSTLNVTIVQADLLWQDAAGNRQHFTTIIEDLQKPTDLIVLPEMFTTGFSMDAAELAETMDGDSVTWMRDMAASSNAAVCGSLIIADNQQYFNRFICASPAGDLQCYDKRHLFRLADEHSHYAAGTELLTFDLQGFRICPMVCYDLRFPVWSRNCGLYDLLLYVANWPDRRHHAWATLLRARAIENLSYVAGVNRTGTDGNNISYSGGSSIIDFLGEDLANLGDHAGTASAELDLEKLTAFRDRFAFHEDADSFAIT